MFNASDLIAGDIASFLGEEEIDVQTLKAPFTPQEKQQTQDNPNWLPNEIWVHEQFVGYPICELYPHLLPIIEDVMCGWLDRFEPRIVQRMFKAKKIFKEFNESAPFILRILLFVEQYEGPKLTIFDLCSGFGFVGMFLSEVLDVEKIHGIYLIDKMFPMRNKESSSTQINVDHIRKYEWPIPIELRKHNIKKSREQKQIASLRESLPGPVIISAIHLCGTLSLKAIEMFNTCDQYVQLLLKPCCLPGIIQKRQKMCYEVGSHSFTAEELYGVRRWLGKFDFWGENLFQCIEVEDKLMETIPVSTSKRQPQNTFIVCAREA